MDIIESGLVSSFYMQSSKGVEQLQTVALQEAINSGEFLVYQAESGQLVTGPLQAAMHELTEQIERGRRLNASLHTDLLNRYFGEMISQVRAQRQRINIAADLLLMTFALHDAVENIVRLSDILLLHCIDPTMTVTMPELLPGTPFEDMVERVAAETATREDVERLAAETLSQLCPRR